MVAVAYPDPMAQAKPQWPRLGRRLRDLRKQTGMTQEEVADRIGYSMSYVSALELGRNQPSTGYLDRFVAGIGGDYTELAELAGLVRPRDDAAWTPPHDKAPLVKEIAGYPLDMVQLAADFLRTMARGMRQTGQQVDEDVAFPPERPVPDSLNEGA